MISNLPSLLSSPLDSIEKEIVKLGYCHFAGIDEAGRGSLAGPVVAAAVILPLNCDVRGVDDSKCLTSRQREILFKKIISQTKSWSVGIIENSEIDRINILRASLAAMKKAAENLPVKPDFLLIDGIYPVSLPILQKSFVKGDKRCRSIAAASIIAKVTRDKMMEGYHRLFPLYNFAKNKGYGTKEHIMAIFKYGVSPIHRKTFRPVRENSC